MQIETLKVFCDLVESRSFSQAAVRNYVTQSAVSQQIKALENRFETPLLIRDGRSVSTTEAGRILHEAAREILDRFNSAQLEMKSTGQEMAGIVRVATIYSVGLYELSRVVKTFLKTYPKVNLHVEYSRANRVYEDCIRGGVDLGIVPYPNAENRRRRTRAPRTHPPRKGSNAPGPTEVHGPGTRAINVSRPIARRSSSAWEPSASGFPCARVRKNLRLPAFRR